ncbi:unnamed protein product [Prunus armeniaca]
MKPTRPSTLMRMISAQLKAQMLGFMMLTTKKVEVVLIFINEGGVETTTFVAIHFMQTKVRVLGLAKLATSTTTSRAYHYFLGFLVFLLLLLLFSFIINGE